jgi:tRNA pseudouridine55 synthase
MPTSVVCLLFFKSMQDESDKPNTSGLMIINKPAGPTSHDIIDQLRKITGIKKIGHAGTLDPFASGVLIVGIGREATKKLGALVKLDKEYIATLRLGAVSDTYDRTGQVSEIEKAERPGLKDVKKLLPAFLGLQKQEPPMYSAKKVKGKKLYQLARANITVKREPALINIFSLELISYRWPLMKIKVRCSSGTYVRTLAHDIGRQLDCGAYLTELTRLSSGEFDIGRAVELSRLTEFNWTDFLFTEQVQAKS